MCGKAADRWRELTRGKAQQWHIDIRIPQHFFRRKLQERHNPDLRRIRVLIADFIKNMQEEGCMIRSYLVKA